MTSHDHHDHHEHHGDAQQPADLHSHRHVDEDMLSVEEAYGRILSFFGPLEPEEKPILECLGQVLAADISSPLDLPPLANSGMDGWSRRYVTWPW